MSRFLSYISNKYFDSRLDFRMRLFNVLAMAGTLVSLISTVVSLCLRDPLGEAALYFLFCIFSAGLLIYSANSGRQQVCYIITIVAIFIIGFSLFFLAGGVYYGAMPYFFVLAVVFTIFMLRGKTALVFALLELVVYTGICIWTYHYFEPAPKYLSGRSLMIETVFGFCAVSIALGLVMFIQIRLYNEQRRKLAEQNHLLEQLNQMKTEFYANVSHDMKTPLTVISVHIQRAKALFELGLENDGEKMRESFAFAQEEIMRLSSMIDKTLRLSSLQEQCGPLAVLNIRDVLYLTAESYKTFAGKKGNVLTVSLPSGLPPVLGNADMLVQLVFNLVSNANAHTHNGKIFLYAKSGAGVLSISVRDNGTGIPPELLPRVFERGVSGGGGSGLGLGIARRIAYEHGGDISIESTPGQGTTVTITLPEYREDTTSA